MQHGLSMNIKDEFYIMCCNKMFCPDCLGIYCNTVVTIKMKI